QLPFPLRHAERRSRPARRKRFRTTGEAMLRSVAFGLALVALVATAAFAVPITIDPGGDTGQYRIVEDVPSGAFDTGFVSAPQNPHVPPGTYIAAGTETEAMP